MSRKTMIMLGMVIGSYLGGLVPTFFGADGLSLSSLLAGGVGGVLGIWLAYRYTD